MEINLEPNDLQLAISYADLAQSVAFQDFLQFQRAQSERLELAALNAPATDFEACRSAIIAWQQRRLRQTDEKLDSHKFL